MTAVYICQGCGAEHATWQGTCPSCGNSETIRLAGGPDRMIDRVIKGKFRIVEKLGQGGMGAVYLAEQVGIGHRVALKFLKAEFSADVEVARRFLNEAKSYARVAHPNAVNLHDFGQDEEGNLFIAMEFCEGVDLKKLIADRSNFSLDEGIDVVLQVADVLANAHQKGVIHRDLKPENVMVRRGIRGLHAKVLDFGIARLMDGSTKLTQAGAIAGTPRYMPPEQVEGRDVDHRADIYSLGILLFEVLTRKQPFDGNTVTEILRKQVIEPMPHLWEVDSELQFAELDAVIQKACSKRREDRWTDMTQFAHALAQTISTLQHLKAPGLGHDPSAAVSPSIVPTIDAGAHTSTDRTFVRTDQKSKKHVQTDLYPLPSAVQTPVVRQAIAEIEDQSMPPKIRRSSTGLLLVGAVLVAAIVGGIALWANNESGEKAAMPAPVALENTSAPADVSASKIDITDDAVNVLHEENSRFNLGKARTEFAVAKISEAETYLNAVESGTTSFAEAQELKKTIAAIREKLRAAKQHQDRGDCREALPIYNSVLQLNARVPEAQQGLSACRAATVETTME